MATPTTQKKSRKWLWITIGVISVAAVATVLYVLFASITPAETAEQHIEDHYDAIAEELAYAVMPDSPLKAELTAEIAESIAERLIPYRCREARGQGEGANLMDIECRISIELRDTFPIPVKLVAPVGVVIAVNRGTLLSPHEVVRTEFAVENITVNGRSLAEIGIGLTGLGLPDGLGVPDLPTDKIPGKDKFKNLFEK